MQIESLSNKHEHKLRSWLSASDGAGSNHRELVFTFHILLTQRTAQQGLGQRLSGVKEGYSESGIKSFTETFSYQDTEQRSGRDLGCSQMMAWVTALRTQ